MKSCSSIVISGDLGGGKTTVSSLLAESLGLRRVSVGQLYRDIAQRHGLSAVEMNLHSERDEAIDDYVDKMQADLANSGEALIVDSRLAWHFFPNAFKVHLLVDPIVASQRVMLRPQNDVEAYASLDEAANVLQVRSNSERARFLKKYGVDKARLRNYDMVCDTTHARPERVAQYISEAFMIFQDRRTAEITSAPFLLLDPLRVYPSEGIKDLRGLWHSPFLEGIRDAGEENIEPIMAAYTGSLFYAVDGHRRLSAAIQCGFSLIPAELLAEGNEEVALGLTAQQYFENEVNQTTIYDWEAVHSIQAPMPLHPRAHATVSSR
jgi:cytidylate kinase